MATVCLPVQVLTGSLPWPEEATDLPEATVVEVIDLPHIALNDSPSHEAGLI